MSLGNALGYLTALRFPPRRQAPLLHSLQYFPWVGAAIGSLTLLLFLAADRILPNILCCLIAVVFPQFLAGWDPWRGVAERMQGFKTHPGYGFRAGFRLDRRGAIVLAALFLVKWLALVVMPLEWQVRAVFVVPILGSCARTGAFLLSPVKGPLHSPLLRRNFIRAGFLTGALLFLVFLFPLRVAIPSLALSCGLAWWLLRRENRRTHGLTLQTASAASEFTEVLMLLLLVPASLILPPLAV
jgi:cobalamin synthase